MKTSLESYQISLKFIKISPVTAYFGHHRISIGCWGCASFFFHLFNLRENQRNQHNFFPIQAYVLINKFSWATYCVWKIYRVWRPEYHDYEESVSS